MPLPPLEATLVLLESIEVHSSTPFNVNGVGDWQYDLHIPNAACYGFVSGHERSALPRMVQARRGVDYGPG